VHGVFDVVERPLDLATERDELTEALGRDRQIQLPGGQRRVRDPPWATVTCTSPKVVTGTSVATTQLGTLTKSTARARQPGTADRGLASAENGHAEPFSDEPIARGRGRLVGRLQGGGCLTRH
jgi:hypothetical protein